MLARLPARILLAAIMGLIAATTLLGCQAEQNPVDSAKAHIDKKEYVSAILKLKTALQRKDSDSEARYLLGLAELKTGDSGAALIDLEKAEQAGYTGAGLDLALAQAMLDQGKFKQIVERFGDRNLKEPDTNAELASVVAWAHARLGVLPKAKALLDQASAESPKNLPVKVVRMRLAAYEGHFDEALKLADEVVAADPSHALAWQLRGDIAWANKRDAAMAEASYRRVLALNGASASGHVGLIRVAMDRKDVEATKLAIAAMEKALPKDPQTRFFVAMAALQRGALDAARADVLELLKAYPQNPKFLGLAGMVELQAGSLPQAQNYLTKAVQMDPGNLPGRRLLATSYLRAGQPAKALIVLREATGADSKDSATLALAAEASLQAGDAKAAELLFRRAAAADPSDNRLKSVLVLAKVATAGFDATLSELEGIAASDKGTYVDWAAVSLALSRKSHDRALALLAGIEAKDARSPVPSAVRATIELEKRDVVAARASLERALARDANYVPALVRLAQLDISQGKADAATSRMVSALKQDPKNYALTLGLAEVKAKAKDGAAEVKALLTAAVSMRPTEPEARVRLTRHLIAVGDSKSALALAQESVSALPDSAVLRELLGHVQMQQGQAEQALATYSRLASDQPQNPGHHLLVAEAYVRLGNFAEAERSLKRALDLRPTFVPAQRVLVAIALTKRDFKSATALARSIQKQRPTEPVGFLIEGDLEAMQRNWTAAEAAYAAADRRGLSAEAALKVIATLYAANRKADAAKRVQAWMAARPRDVDFIMAIGDQRLAAGDLAAAEAAFAKALELQPKHPIALNNLAWVLHRQGKPGAMERAEEANRVLPGNPSVMDTLASLLAQAGRYKEAITLQVKAVEAAPYNANLRLNLGKIYLSSGEKPLARAEFDKVSQDAGGGAAREEAQKLLKSMS